MNRSTKYVKNQELKRFNNIKGKKKYLLTSKVIEYSNAIVHAFQKFKAPFSGKICTILISIHLE